ncbi:MAG: ribosome biogenesis GTPase YlqF [Ruminococcaceae bacterium]|nr:ribosome biogenesis GTPase YlqF [Oscillospiraceae bacterium]
MPGQNIQWFPGHMAKTRRMISENLSNVDIVIELLDARIPKSSKNPEIKRLVGTKPMVSLLNKSSLADPDMTARFKRRMEEEGQGVIVTDCISGHGLGDIEPKIREVLHEKLERYDSKGMSGRAVKAMILGIPNVGKSSLINRLCGFKKAAVEDRPGVTLQKQWVKTNIGIELLDMPGVLWPKFDDRTVAENLAITGAIKDDVLYLDDITIALLERLRERYPAKLAERYKLSDVDMTPVELLEAIGRKRGFLVSGGEVDYDRCCITILDELRGGKIGRITLDIL